MKHVIGLYVVMLASEFVFKGNYSAIASWITVMLFLFGTIFFVNTRNYLSKK